MLRKFVYTTLAGLAGVVLAGVVFSQPLTAQEAGQAQLSYSGWSLYASYCSNCHGDSGKGNGNLAPALRSKPTDLTALAKNNGGTFATSEIVRIVDGRNPIKAHGNDMPVWGDAFARTADGPGAVAGKIESLVVYLESIQQKP